MVAENLGLLFEPAPRRLIALQPGDVGLPGVDDPAVPVTAGDLFYLAKERLPLRHGARADDPLDPCK